MQNKDIEYVITQGRAFKSSSFLLKMAKNIGNVKKNVSIIAPKKQFTTAVLRNKARRRLKGIFLKAGLKFGKEHCFVFTLNKTILSLQPSELNSEFEQFLLKNAILKS